MDRDASGCLTAQEFQSALKECRVPITSEQVTQFVAGLQNNAGLLNYQTITKQLLAAAQSGVTSRRPGTGNSATASKSRPATSGAAVAAADSRHTTGPAGSNSAAGHSRPATADSATARPPASNAASQPAAVSRLSQTSTATANGNDVVTEAALQQQQQQQVAPKHAACLAVAVSQGSRPSSAPASLTHTRAMTKQDSKSASYWFGASGKDPAAISNGLSWMPTKEADTSPVMAEARMNSPPPWGPQGLGNLLNQSGVASELLGGQGGIAGTGRQGRSSSNSKKRAKANSTVRPSTASPSILHGGLGKEYHGSASSRQCTIQNPEGGLNFPRPTSAYAVLTTSNRVQSGGLKAHKMQGLADARRESECLNQDVTAIRRLM